MGTETRGLIRDIRFESCDVFDGDRGIVLYARDGGPIERVTWRNIRLFMIDWPQEKESGAVLHLTVERRVAPTPVRDCLVENVSANWIFRSEFAGLPEAPLTGVRLRNIRAEADRPKQGRPALFSCRDNVRIEVDGLAVDWRGHEAEWAGVAAGKGLQVSTARRPDDAQPLYQAPPNHRIEKTVNRQWTFNYFPSADADGAGCPAPEFDDSSWPAVALPHTWSTYETTGKLHPYIHDAAEKDDPYWWQGWGWYRKHFGIGKEQAGRKVFVEFDGVQKYCKVFINGKLVGDHKGGYTSFYFDLTDHVRFGGDNVIAVAVNNRQNDPFRIPPMSAGNFDVYGGIYRDARLVIKDRLHIPFQGAWQHEGGTFVTTPAVSTAAAEVRIRTWLRNEHPAARECELRTSIVDASNRVLQVLSARTNLAPGGWAALDQTSEPIREPCLWSPETPYLYRVHSDVLADGVVVDHFETPLGVREFKWDYAEDRLVLNGKKVIIHGSNRHQEYPWLGDATPKWLHRLDMNDFRYGLNHNFMRTAHYPNDPCIYDFNDRHGIITIEEMPNIKRQEFSEEVQVHQLREAIRRDRNHPAIFFWSMGNETDHAVDSRYALEEDTTRLIHARDIYNESAGTNVNTTSKQLALESLLRCTIRGWYNSDVRDLQPESAQQAGTETWQHDRNAKELTKRNEGRAPDDRANVNTWLYADHGCDRDYANAPLKYVNPKGYVDSWRTPKYFYYLWQAFYAEKPMVFIHPHFWRPQYLGQKKEIVVDSNCDTVELKVNGRSIGRRQPRFEDANVVRFKDVTVEQGVLSAEGTKAGQVVTARVVMAGPPARLVLEANPGTVEAGLDSVAIIRADIVDAAGTHVYGATNTLLWAVSGPATLVGAPVYTSDVARHEERSGTMYIDAPAFNVVRSSGKPGEIKVTVRSPGLASGEVRLTAVPAPEDGLTAIVEPPVPEGKRQPVARQNRAARVPAASAQEMRPVSEDIHLAAASVEDAAKRIRAFLRERNPALDIGAPEAQAVVAVFAHHLLNNQGSLVRDDFNFTVGFYNDCRNITRQIQPLKLPVLFKQALSRYYAQAMIERGEAKDPGIEMEWLGSLPPGKLVVAGAGADAPGDPGVLRSNQRELDALVGLALPEFKNLQPARQAAALEVVCGLNPWILRQAVRTGGEKVDGVRQKTTEAVRYWVPPGQPILVPSLEELTSRAGKTRN